MRSVKEVSELTGISVRTLRWYDEIGLFKPTATSEAGYRFYDDKALETLQQILFFREFDIPLKDIKAIFESPDFDREEVLRSQKKLLELKRNRLNRLIDSIEGILRGENCMDFEIFTRDDVEELFQTFVKNAPEPMLQESIKEFGSMEAFQKNYVEKAYTLYNKPENSQLLLETYGDKENVLEAGKHPIGEEGVAVYQQEIDSVINRLVLCKREGFPAEALETKMLICEYALATKKAFRLKNERHIVTSMADTYENYEQARNALDQQYEEPGIAEYLMKGIRAFYGK